jgi:curved DNA-binding protein CbpA
MGNDISNDISREDLVEIQRRQIALEEQNKRIKHALEKEKRSKASLKSEISELKTSSKTTRSRPLDEKKSTKHTPIIAKNTEKVTVKVNKSTVQVDPYELFGLEPDCSLEDIKGVYKKLVVKYHPDKSGYDSTDDYKTLQKTYALLFSIKQDELKVTGLLKQTIETKTDERRDLDTHLDRKNVQFDPASGQAFDRNKFNQMYEQNKFVEEEADGYADWLKDSSGENSQPNIGAFTKDGFNNAFEQHAKHHSNSKQMAQFIEPDSYFTYSGGFDNLGGTEGNDYSSDGKYTDLKKAYTQANILHPGEVKNREQYTTISQLKAARDAPIQLTKEEQEFLVTKQSREQEYESTRVTRQREKDKKIEEFYTRLHGRSIELPTYKRS